MEPGTTLEKFHAFELIWWKIGSIQQLKVNLNWLEYEIELLRAEVFYTPTIQTLEFEDGLDF